MAERTMAIRRLQTSTAGLLGEVATTTSPLQHGCNNGPSQQQCTRLTNPLPRTDRCRVLWSSTARVNSTSPSASMVGIMDGPEHW